jgi:multidrug efflux pump subunit AcrA (membrane-fusion protein)
MKYQKQLIVLFFAIALISCKQEKTEESTIKNSEIIAVKTYELKPAEKNIIVKSTGLLTTENEAKYSFKIGGVIDHIYVSDGESFRKGKLLAKLKTEEIDAGFEQAKLSFEKAERDLIRLTNLYKDSVVTLEQLQNTQTAYEISKKQLQSVAFNKEYAFIYAINDGFVTKKNS